MKKMTKSNRNRMLAGVCGGIAEYFNIDPTIIRLAMCVLTILGGSGVLVYIVACIVLPAPDFKEDVDSMRSANSSPDDSDERPEKGGRSDSEFDSYFKK